MEAPIFTPRCTICIAVLSFAQTSLRSAWSCKAVVVVGVHRSVDLPPRWLACATATSTPPPPLLVRNLSRYTTGRSKKEEWRPRRIPCFACFASGRTNRFDPIRFPKGSAQKQQTHLNHAVLILRKIAPPSLPQVTQSAPWRETVVACSQADQHPPSWRLQQRPIVAVHVCKKTHAQLGHHPCVHSRTQEA
jgi:hypothetical protein